MRKFCLVTLLGVAFAFGASAPAMAHGSWSHKDHYLRAKVYALGGSPGCDLVAHKCHDTKVTQATVHGYFSTMRRMVRPRPRPVVHAVVTHAAPVQQVQAAPTATATATPYQAPYQAPSPQPSSSSGTGSYSIPKYIVDCESGGNYNARNPSGAYGAYQIMPGTSRAYGCDMSTASGQDQCAAKIYAREGAAPWSCG